MRPANWPPTSRPETFSLFVLALSDGLQSLWLIDRNFDIAEAVSACLRLVVTERPPIA